MWLASWALALVLLWGAILPGKLIRLGVDDGLILTSPDGHQTEIYAAPGLYWVPAGWETQAFRFDDKPGRDMPDWDEAAHLAVLWDRECDRLRASVVPLTEEDLPRVVTYARWQAQAEGFAIADWDLQGVRAADFGKDASRVAGRYLPKSREIEVSVRYLEGWDWSEEPSWSTVYHEVAHSAGILSEDVAQLATAEMLAGDANAGKEQAKIALVCELRSWAVTYLRYLATAPAFLARDQMTGYLPLGGQAQASVSGQGTERSWRGLDLINSSLRALYAAELQRQLEELERRVYETEEQWSRLQRWKRQLPVRYPNPSELERVRVLYGVIPFATVWRVWTGEAVEVELAVMSERWEQRTFQLDELRWFLEWHYGAPGR